jgi:hypothetical protein
MAINQFFLARDFAGNNSLIRNAPEYVDARVLAAGAAEVYTVPTGAHLIVFSGTSAFYARANAAAAVPAADVTDGSSSELNPSAWLLRSFGQLGGGAAISTIGLISSANCVVTMAVYKLN